MVERLTTCRICEAACGLRATVEGGRVTALAPDADHPISAGYACVKGTRFHERVLHHPDRLTRPQLGRGDARREATWAEALAFIGQRLQDVGRRRGWDAIGLYSGNAVGHSLQGVLGVTALQRALGTHRHYSCLTLDNSEMFLVAEAVFGHPLTTFVADYAGADLVVLFGTDPLSSQASQAQSHPRANADLRACARRGALVVLDPRRSVTASKATLHLSPRVGTDVFVLAYLVNAALNAGRGGAERAELLRAVSGFDLSRAARVSGLDEGKLSLLAARLLGARRPLVWSGLGVLLGASGTLGWWLTLVLQAVLVGLDTPGGWRWQPGPLDLPRWASRLGLSARDTANRSAVGGYPSLLGTWPAATLATDALQGGLAALLVFGGDPASSLPDTHQARRALDQLELVVSVDLFGDRTAASADVVLPATTWVERDEAGVPTSNQRPGAFLRLDRAVIDPVGETRSDLDIALAICEAAGRIPFGSRIAHRLARRFGATGLTRAACWTAGVSWAEVTAASGARVHVDGGRAPAPRLAVPAFVDALAVLPDLAPEVRLVTSVRPASMMNHWLRDEATSVVLAHPDRAPAGPARLEGDAGFLDVVVVSDETLEPSTIVLPFGDARCNPNTVIGTRSLEPFTGQPVSNGAPVRLFPRR